jgi:transcriptional regulator with XRE-family HTH domain
MDEDVSAANDRVDGRRLKRFLQGIRNAHNWKLEEIAARAGMPVSSLQRFDVGDVKYIGPQRAAKLAGGYRVSVPKLLTEAGYDVGLETIEGANLEGAARRISFADYLLWTHPDVADIDIEALAKEVEDFIQVRVRRIRSEQEGSQRNQPLELGEG